MRIHFFFSAFVAAGFVIACSAAERRSSFEPARSTDKATAGNEVEGDVSGFGNGTVPVGTPTSCATAEAAAPKPPIDIIVVVDQSGSMSAEIASIKASINNLSSILAASGIDYRLVMIARKGTSGYEVCVPPPLGGPNCASNPPNFRTVNQVIGSTDALSLILSTLDITSGDKAWADFLRPNALKVFIPVTDDNSYGVSATQFDSQILTKASGAFGSDKARTYKFFPIVGAEAFPSQTKCSTAENPGSVYLELAKLTDGKWFPVCSASFAPVFDEIGSTLSAQSACKLAIPTPANGGQLDRDRINVKFTSSTGGVNVVPLDKSAACDAGADGWQFSADGSQVVLCGPSCVKAQKDLGSRVDVEFGCATQVR